MSTQEGDDFRLPKNMRPTRYTIFIKPDFETFTFTGTEYVDLDIKNPTNRIVMNAAGLEVNHVRILGILPGGKTQIPLNVTLDEKRETITIELDEVLMPGPEVVSLDFKGILNDNLCGFYRSRYALQDGTERYMATTQFEAIDARRAFPCFDEPEYKAVFELNLAVPEDRIALSNMPVHCELSISIP